MPAKLPVHGFVLAGGQSTRMGEDKALLRFCGHPMVEIAVEKLRSICAEVGIAGDRTDLSCFAEIAPETRVRMGPASGVEGGLQTAKLPWVLFVPVDVPLMPPAVLRAWTEAVLSESDAGIRASYLVAAGEPQPAFCILRQECLRVWSEGLDSGERRLSRLLSRLDAGLAGAEHAAVQAFDVESVARMLGLREEDAPLWLSNVNTPRELADAEAKAHRAAPPAE